MELNRVVFGVIAVLVLGVFGAEAQQPERTAPGAEGVFERGVQNSRILISQGRHREALAILRGLVRERGFDKNVAFLRGLAALEAAQQSGGRDEGEAAVLLEEAIGAFRGLLVGEPGLVRVRLELARAFFNLGEDDLAKEHFERVLAGDPPAPVIANVRSFLWRIRARRRWSVNMGFALAPDTNIGGQSDARVVEIFGLPFRRDSENLTTSGVGLSVWGGGEYHHPVGERLRLRMGADLSSREYSKDEFNKLLVSVHAGPRVLASRSTQFSVLANWRNQWTGNKRDYFDLGGRLQVRHRLARRLTLAGNASWHDRRYYTNKALDGPVRSISVNTSWVVRPTVRANLTVGHGRDRPLSLRNRNENTWLQTGVSLVLPYGFNLSGTAGYRWTDYEASWPPHTPSGVVRKDETLTLRASVLNRGFTLFGFSPQLSVVREVRETNAQLYDYRRTSGELRFVRQF